MNKFLKNTSIVIMCVVLLLGFNASYTSLNIDNLAYVVAIGIDVGKNDVYKVSFQFIPRSSEEKSESSTSSNGGKTVINTVEAPSLNTAINLTNSYLARKINLSHCKVIIFSEQVAAYGISKEIYSLINNSQARPSANIIICKNSAERYIKDTNPILENLITKYYELFPNSGKYTGYIYNATLGDFFNQLVSNTCEPFAILGGINSNMYSNNNKISYSNNTGNMKSTETSFSGLRGSENIGVAVFKDDKLVGELNATETLCLSIIKGEVSSFLIHVPNPKDSEKEIDLIIYPSDKRNVTVDIVNGSPYITFSEKFVGKIYSASKDKEYLNAEEIKNLSDLSNKYLENILKNYLYKTSATYGSDINDFGRYALSKFLTIDQFNEYDWKNNYKNSTFKVSVDTQVQTGFLITEIKE